MNVGPQMLPGSIALATRCGTPIPNEQYRDASPIQAAIIKREHAKRHGMARLRREATAVYNCHGCVFAGRRTCIAGEEATGVVRSILDDDGYHQVSLLDTVVGDVVIYAEADGGFSHSATVVAIEDNTLIPGGRAVEVISKWGYAGEYQHALRECPYFADQVTFWTDRHATAQIQPTVE